MAVLHVHHHGQRNAARFPLVGGLGDVADGRHVASQTSTDQCGGVVAQRIAVVGVEIRRSRATAFIAEEVGLRGELHVVARGTVVGLDVRFDHRDEQFFRLDLGDLDVAMRVTVAEQLGLNERRQRLEDGEIVALQMRFDEFDLGVHIRQCVELVAQFGAFRHGVVQFGDQRIQFGHEFDQAFRNQHDAEVHLLGGAFDDEIRQIPNDLVEGDVLLLDFFGDDARIRMRLQSAFQRDMGGGAAHQFDEVPVFAGGVGVTHDVADQFGIDLRGGVETEGDFDPFVLQIAVDGLRAADDLDAGLLVDHVLRQNAGVRVGVVAADDDDGVDVQSFAVDDDFVELFGLLKLRTAGADHVKTARVAVCVDDGVVQKHVFVVDEAGRTAEETVQFGLRVQRLQTIVKTCDDVMSARSLAAGQNDGDVQRLHLALRAFLEFDGGQAVGVREEFLDGRLVGDGFRGFAENWFRKWSGCAQNGRKFGLIGGTRRLQGGNLTHDTFLLVDNTCV